MYEYQAEVVRWVDGDTVYLTVDLGFRMSSTTSFRLYGIDTPERGRPGAKDASARAAELAPAGSEVHIRTHKDPDKYGRWLVEVEIPERFGVTVNEVLVEEGHAVGYFGGTKGVPVP
ncbi:nuclease [Arthrobacter phage Altadena]|uniref:Nuclease n=1 Tax=Arthrobacter phage Altadena TaxID=3059064 RepID=A0AA96HU22_9CAUD|nr:nuclease [Arthrobacter phage Altadena]